MGGKLLCPEGNAILRGAAGGVEDATGHGAEFAVVRVLVELDQDVVIGGERFGHKDKEVGPRSELGRAFGALDMAVRIAFDYAIGGNALEDPPGLGVDDLGRYGTPRFVLVLVIDPDLVDAGGGPAGAGAAILVPAGLATPLFIAALREIIAATTASETPAFLSARRPSVDVS